MTVKIGILGFAHGHVNSYCKQWQAQPAMEVEVVAGWDHDQERLSKAVQDFSIEGAESPSALLQRPDIDAVVIATETAYHAQYVEEAASAGKAIVLQKPMALTLDEADRIVAAVDRSKVPFTMAWQMRTDPQNQKMRDMIHNGDIGRVFMVRRRHGLPMCLRDDFATSWHVNPALNRDIWADDSSHPIDFIYWMLGMPESVTAEIVSLHNPKMPMDNGVAIFRYPGGPLAEVCCSFTNNAAENTTEIVGEKGSILQNYGDGPSCNISRPENAIGLKWFLAEEGKWIYSDITTPASHGERIAGLAGPLSEFLRGRRPPIATAEDGRNALQLVLASYVSTNSGTRIRMDDDRIRQV